MRNVEPVLEHKMDEAVTHYINSHQPPESVHVDANSLALNEDDSGDRVVTIMHPPNFTTQMCRQISAGDQVGEGPWVEELLDPEGRLAAIVAHLAQHSRTQHQHLHKVPIRSELDSSVILDTPMRLYNGQTMHEHSPEPIVVQVPSLPPLPPLQEMKRCPETDWLIKDKDELKDQQLLSQDAVLEASASPAHKQSKKSLPHKKRISRKLKRTTNSTPQQDIVVINCGSEVAQEEILPDSFAHGHDSHDTSNVHDAHGVHGPHDPHNSVLPEPHHIGQEINMRSLFVCQLCGEFYGHEQLKFYQHLKHHYEPQLVLDHPDLPIDKVRPYSTYYSSTVTSSSSSSSTEAQHLMHAPDLPINKMTNTCIDNVATLPDSIVELSLENTVPRIIYPPPDKAFSSYKIPFNPSNMEKEQEGRVDLFDSLDKLEMYFCTKCSKSFRKQKQCEIHIKEVHLNQRLDDISEFSDPEDLMEGIHVAVEDGGGDGEGGGEGSEEHYDQALLPHLTVENGQVHQEHVRHWYLRNGSNSVPLCTCGGAGYCAMCTDAHAPNIPPTQTIHTQTVHTQSPNVPLPSVTSVSHVTTSHVTNVTTVSHTSNATVSQNATPSQRTDKDESLQRIFESDDHSQEDYTENIPEQRSLRIKVEKPGAEKVEKKKSTKTFECSHCDRVFRHRNSLFYHALMHSEKQHVCKECGKEFYTVNALKIHKRVHTDDRPCKCEECGKTFRQYSDLRYHKASLHSDKKNYKCDFCGKEFARRYSLNLHRRIHTGEKNYKCEYCNKSFRASCYRLSHMRTHTGTKPHKCTQCEKSFRVAYDLRRHMQIHDKVRVRGDEQKNKTKEKKQSVKVQQQTKVKEQQQTKVKETKPEAAQSPHDKKETRSSILKSLLDKKSKPPKIPPKKAPNVTVQNRADDQFKIDTEYNNEAFDTRQDQYKFKVYCTGELKQKEFVESIRLEERAVDRELATLRSLKNHQICDIEGNKIHFARENTDGKMQVYTQIEKTKEYNGPIVTNTVSLSDIRSIDRDVRDPRNEIHGETIDSALLERLSAYYNNNIPAV